jgi:hypothetical protein
MRTLLTIFFGLALSSQAATIFTVTFSPATISGLPGDVITLNGTLTNNDLVNNEYINSDGITLGPGFAVDDNPFFTFAPLFLAPGASTAPFAFLTITISPSQSPGLYGGAFDVIGGADGGDNTGILNLGTGTFNVNVLGTPEPSSIGLFLSGAALLIARRRKR